MYDNNMEELNGIGEEISRLEQQLEAAREKFADLKPQPRRMTKEEICAIKDTSKRRKAIAENLDLFRK